MAHKFARALVRKYCEIDQPNPLRWEILFLDEDQVFKPQTAKFKCKDFLNDYVAKLTGGKDIAIYGMDTSTVKINDNGMWIRLSNIKGQELFINNINRVVNEKLQAELGLSISCESLKANKVLMFIPKGVFINTYLISQVAWLIRLCNYGVELKSWEEAIDHAITGPDRAIQYSGKNLMKKWGFKVPEKYSEFWWYQGNNYNSKCVGYVTGSQIHNNGVMSWSNYVS